MKIETVKINDLPEANSLAGLTVLGINAGNEGVQVDLDYIPAAAAKVGTAIENAANAVAQAPQTQTAVREAVTQANSARSAANSAATSANQVADYVETMIDPNEVQDAGYDCIVHTQEQMDALVRDASSFHHILIAEDVVLAGELSLIWNACLTALAGKTIYVDQGRIRTGSGIGSGCRVHHAKFVCQVDLNDTLFDGVDFVEQVQVEISGECQYVITNAKLVRDVTVTVEGMNHSSILETVGYADHVYVRTGYSYGPCLGAVTRVNRCVAQASGRFDCPPFESCYSMSHCEAIGDVYEGHPYYYSSCFADKLGEYPVADTLAGGYNSSTAG